MVGRRQSGYIALMAVLVLGAAALSIATALLTTGLDSQRGALIHQRYAQAQSLARYCGEEALQQIHDNIAFTTSSTGTTVSAGQGSCTYIVAVQTATTRSIRVTATVGDVVRRIQALATINATTISITSWTDEDKMFSTISHVQTNTTTNDVSASNIAQSFRAPVTAGDLIVVAVGWDTASAIGTLTCSDTSGNTYTTVNIWNDSTGTQALGICYAPNVAAGSPTITATFSAAKVTRRMVLSEYSGVSTAANPVDVSTGVGGGAATTATNGVTSGSVTPTLDGDLIYGATMNAAGTGTMTAGTGFTQRGFTNLKDLATQDFQQLTAASVASTMTFGTAQRYDAAVIAFKAATN